MVAAHILVIGATGQSGLEFCSAALNEGHQLTLYVRNPGKVPAAISGNEKVTVIHGTLENESSLRKAIESGATIFVSFAGPVGPSKAHHRCDEVDIPPSDSEQVREGHGTRHVFFHCARG